MPYKEHILNEHSGPEFRIDEYDSSLNGYRFKVRVKVFGFWMRPTSKLAEFRYPNLRLNNVYRNKNHAIIAIQAYRDSLKKPQYKGSTYV